MPKVREVHTDPDEVKATQAKPFPADVENAPVEHKSPAQWAYERLVLYIKNFEERLDSDHEVAMGFTDTGAGVLKIEGIGFFDPDVVTFYGIDGGGARAQLVQHVTQLNVMLRAVPKPQEVDAPRRIGFQLAAALNDD
ncbi:MAG: DUF6173 family protein [Pseudomonadota bacterium]